MKAWFAGYANTPQEPATPTRQLMKRPTALHGGTRKKRQHRMHDIDQLISL